MTQQKARFEVGDILYLSLTLVVAGIGIAFGLNMLNTMKSDMCNTGYTFNSSADNCYLNTNNTVKESSAQLNATLNTVTGVSKFSSKMGLVATVLVAAIVIGILVRYLFVRNN